MVNLGLVIDSSGSIGLSNFNIVKSGYASALATLPTDGSVAIAVEDFSSYYQSATYADTVIDSVAARDGLIAFINSMPYYGGMTALSDAILSTGGGMYAANFGATKNVIDVSTDGFDNDSVTSLNPNQASLSTIANDGIDQVNCLGIGSSADCSLQAGTGSFSYTNVSYSEFSTILGQKIQREVVVSTPEPAAFALFAAGLAALGLFAARRRLRATH